jgi:hypothetical protein
VALFFLLSHHHANIGRQLRCLWRGNLGRSRPPERPRWVCQAPGQEARRTGQTGEEEGQSWCSPSSCRIVADPEEKGSQG